MIQVLSQQRGFICIWKFMNIHIPDQYASNSSKAFFIYLYINSLNSEGDITGPYLTPCLPLNHLQSIPVYSHACFISIIFHSYWKSHLHLHSHVKHSIIKVSNSAVTFPFNTFKCFSVISQKEEEKNFPYSWSPHGYIHAIAEGCNLQQFSFCTVCFCSFPV